MPYALRGAGTYEVDPISRIEGHLGVKVTTNSSGYITEADAHGNLWRGFENFLLGREVNDAITFTQRICGVCPVPHGLTSTHAVDTVLGYSAGHITFAYDGTYGIPKPALHIRNLVAACDSLMSSLTHSYHLAAPSYIQGPAIPPWTPFFDNDDYHPLMLNPGGSSAAPSKAYDGVYPDNLWSAVIKSYVKALRIRRLVFEAGALFAGRMPMTSCFVAGGVTNYWSQAELEERCDKFATIMAEVGKFVVTEFVPVFLALGALYPGFDNLANATTLYGVGAVYLPAIDASANLWTAANGMNTSAPAAGTTGFGAGLGRFLSWGAYPDPDTNVLFSKGGMKDVDASANDFLVANKADVASMFLAGGTNAVPDNLTESIYYSRYDIADIDTDAYDANEAAYPGDVARTMPLRGKSGAYTYMKAPRWNNLACEVGPLARLAVGGAVPCDGATTYASTGLFAPYLKGSGLDPKMVNADIAVGLLREGLATLYSGGTTYTWDDVDASGADAATITSLYTASDAEIRGIIYAWVTNLVSGLSTMDRLRARALESLLLVQAVIGAYDKGTDTFAGDGWVNRLKDMAPSIDVDSDTMGFCRNIPVPAGTRQGWGAHEATRGALMHQATIVGGKITKYQCIVPTTWNGSPKNKPLGSGGERGAMEEAMIGAPFSAEGASFTSAGGSTPVTSAGGVEVMRIAQSFDPCIACAIH